MFFPRTILLWFALLTTAKCDDDVVCDVDLVWYEAGKIEPHEYSAKSNVTDDLRNATKIEIAQNVSTLRYLELSFASDLKVLVVDNVGLTTIEPGALKSIPWTVENLTVTRNKMAAIPAGVFKVSSTMSFKYDKTDKGQVVTEFQGLQKWRPEYRTAVQSLTFDFFL